MWATGILAYECMVGRPPFEVRDEVCRRGLCLIPTFIECDVVGNCAHVAQKETAHRIMHSDQLDFPARHSAAWRDFVRRALQKQPHLRPTAAQLLAHPWLKPARADNIPRSPTAQPVLPQSSPTSIAHAASLRTPLMSPAISVAMHAARDLAPATAIDTASCELHGELGNEGHLASASATGRLADAAAAPDRAIGAPANPELHTAPDSAASTAERAFSAGSSTASEQPSNTDQALTARSAFVDAGSSSASCTDSSPRPDASRAERTGHALVARLAAGRAASKGVGVTVLRAGLALLYAPDSTERPFSSSAKASPLARPGLRILNFAIAQAEMIQIRCKSCARPPLAKLVLLKKTKCGHNVVALAARTGSHACGAGAQHFCNQSCLAASGEALDFVMPGSVSTCIPTHAHANMSPSRGPCLKRMTLCFSCESTTN